MLIHIPCVRLALYRDAYHSREGSMQNRIVRLHLARIFPRWLLPCMRWVVSCVPSKHFIQWTGAYSFIHFHS